MKCARCGIEIEKDNANRVMLKPAKLQKPPMRYALCDICYNLISQIMQTECRKK